MARRAAASSQPRNKRKKRKPLFGWLKLWPRAATRRRWVRAFSRAPLGMQCFVGAFFVVTLWLVVNWVYQVIRKPSELFFPVSGTLNKSPAETWRQYSPLFKEHATGTISAEYLAALAQVEGSGNPIARTYWRWTWKPAPFELYRPASSAVGMYQMTDGTFAEARQFCVHDHAVVQAGAWDDWHACWFNSLYFRVIPGDAVELTSAYLDVHVRDILARRGIEHASSQQKQSLASVIHLCGAGAADLYARHGFHFAAGQVCGDHDPRIYLSRVESMRRVFVQLAARSEADD